MTIDIDGGNVDTPQAPEADIPLPDGPTDDYESGDIQTLSEIDDTVDRNGGEPFTGMFVDLNNPPHTPLVLSDEDSEKVAALLPERFPKQPESLREAIYKVIDDAVTWNDIVDPEAVDSLKEAFAVTFERGTVWRDIPAEQRPRVILSEVEHDHPSGPIVVGWDTCDECKRHISMCRCLLGPTEPGYVAKWRPYEPSATKEASKLTAAEQANVDRYYPKHAAVEADPQDVEKAVDEALNTEELTPTGRKKRRDAGQKRGPRTKGTPQTVLEAAGDLSAAMTKET